MPSKTEMYDCSVVVCSYRPVWEKLRLTLKSILMQEQCDYQIVVTDDGSTNNLFDKIEEFFSSYGFTDYKLVASHKNRGTVQNVLQGVNVCSGEFVKLLSPGDFLHTARALREWTEFMRTHVDCVISCCEAIYYHIKDGKVICTRENSHPQRRALSVSQYLICDDIALGAAIMVRRDAWLEYLEMIADKIVYAEDNSYRIMIYRGNKMIYNPQSFVLYEYGTGISTSGNDVWAERLRKDWQMADQIMLSLEPCDEARHVRVPEYLRLSFQKGSLVCWRRWMRYPARFYYGILHRFFPKKTPVSIDESFVTELLR